MDSRVFICLLGSPERRMDARGSDAEPPTPDAPAPGAPTAPTDNLAAYRAKRSPDRSPEPVGTVHATPGRLFVVHKHAARQLHFDLRLEMDGVLRSWAVPKGPSYDQNDKRLAVLVEDHPLEYGDFEGVIPDGNYGAGGVIVWDRGEWVALEDPREGLEKGKLLFELKGYKLHGKWTLVKIKKTEKEWLLIKERDAWLKSPGDQFPEESVLSGLTVEEVKAGKSPSKSVRQVLEQLDVPRTIVPPKSIELMLADTRETAFTDPAWVFELKLDGYRLLAAKSHHDVLLLSRNGNDYTEVFPEIARAIAAIPVDRCVLDGEVVVLDPTGKPSFSRLQQRGALTNTVDIRRTAVELPATYFSFDLIAFEDFDVRSLPLLKRKELLAQVLPSLGPVRYLDHVEGQGEAFLAQVVVMGLEGIIAKKSDVPYRGGRSPFWLKIKADQTGDFVIVGFTAPKGNRSGFGALQLADYVRGKLVYAGRAGTGFNDQLLRELRTQLDPLVRSEPPCLGPVTSPTAEPLPADAIPDTRTTTWVEPRFVCEVRFREWTPDGVLRHPAFIRMRNDKDPHQCDRQHWNVAPDGEATATTVGSLAVAPPPEPSRKVVTKTVTFSNPNKVFWPAERYTKGDLIEYYRAISPWLLPYLINRPVVLTRFPDGIDGKSFYQKDAPEFAPEWVRTTPIWSTDTEREIRYFVCDDLESLLYIANMGTIPLHIWASRVGSLELPDWCVIDLDPKEAPFSDVIRCAQVLHRVCEEIALPNYVKTTGKSGLHILIPLARQCTYEQSRTLGELLARLVLRDLQDIATITRHVTKRGDKVYLDYLQNRHGQLIVSPFSVRPLAGAPVSMPLTWDEVNDGLDPRNFTIQNAVERMEAFGRDPVRPVLEEKADLAVALERLAVRFNS
ncbi:MAG: DNA ligase D [Gemmatimonadaceae bacterium]